MTNEHESLFSFIHGHVWMVRNFGWRRWWRACVRSWNAPEAEYELGDWRHKPKPDDGQIHA